MRGLQQTLCNRPAVHSSADCHIVTAHPARIVWPLAFFNTKRAFALSMRHLAYSRRVLTASHRPLAARRVALAAPPPVLASGTSGQTGASVHRPDPHAILPSIPSGSGIMACRLGGYDPDPGRTHMRFPIQEAPSCPGSARIRWEVTTLLVIFSTPLVDQAAVPVMGSRLLTVSLPAEHRSSRIFSQISVFFCENLCICGKKHGFKPVSSLDPLGLEKSMSSHRQVRNSSYPYCA